MEEIYNKAIRENTWSSLVPYPMLLMRWQIHYPQDNKRIATVSSHKLGNHLWCDTPEKCKTVDDFIKEHTPGQKQIWKK